MDIYTGNGKRNLPDFVPSVSLQRPEHYVVSPALQKAINIALLLGQPLLLTGEPGTGKTQLAYHLANYFDPEGLNDNLYIFHAKSYSKATDLLYQYDSLKHYQYSHHHTEELSAEEIETLFIRYCGLGAAIKSGLRSIVLVDGIDRAPRDLPYDLLNVLEDLSFEVPEIGRIGQDKIRTTHENRPFVIITSNSEKTLPDAFLRRCIYYHIPFPKEDQIIDIIKEKMTALTSTQMEIIVQHVLSIRKLCTRKAPATAEVLQWIGFIERLERSGQLQIEQLARPEEMNVAQRYELLSSYSIIIKDKIDLERVKKELYSLIST